MQLKKLTLSRLLIKRSFHHLFWSFRSESSAHATFVSSCTVTVCTPFLFTSSSSLFPSPHLCPTHDYCSFYRITITDKWGVSGMFGTLRHLHHHHPSFSSSQEASFHCMPFSFSHFEFSLLRVLHGQTHTQFGAVGVCVCFSVWADFGCDASSFIRWCRLCYCVL